MNARTMQIMRATICDVATQVRKKAEEAEALADAGKSAEAYVVADMGLRWAMNYFACATKSINEMLERGKNGHSRF